MTSIPTLRELALEAGVSHATLSNALRGKGRISDVKRQYLLQFAEKRGYFPRPVLAALSDLRRFHRTRLDLSLIIILSNYPSHYEDMISAAHVLGYHARIRRPGVESAEALHKEFFEIGAVGVVLINTEREDLLRYDWFGMSIICSGAVPFDCPYHRVGGDCGGGISLAWKYLLTRGCVKIGAILFSHSPIIEDDQERMGRVLVCQTLVGGGDIPPYIHGFDEADQVEDWARRYHPDGIIAFHGGVPSMGNGILQGLPVAFLHVHPSDRGNVGIESNPKRFSTAIVRLLDSCIRSNDTGQSVEPMKVQLNPVWHGL